MDSPEVRDLMKTRTVPMNRKQRRAIAKRAHVRFNVVNEAMAKPAPTYLGIREFKSKTNDKSLVETYKHNAHQSKRELDERRAIEHAKMLDSKMDNLEKLIDEGDPNAGDDK